MKAKLPKVEELLDSGVHFGHQTKRWHPKMEPFIFGVKRNIHIIDLEQTEAQLKKATEFLNEVAARGEQIILVGTKKQAREVVELEAKRSGSMFVIERWVGGTITNYRIIKKNIDKLLTLIKRREEGDLEKYTKKERLLIDREIEKLQKNIGGIVNLKGTPGALFVVDARRERTAIREAKIAGVKVVALVDTNSNPEGIDYVIPGNDDAIKSIAIILKAVADAVESGYQEFAKKSADDKAAAQKAAEKAAADKIAADKAAEEAKNSAIKVTVAEAPRIVTEEVEVLEKVLTEETKEEKTKKGKIDKEEVK